MNTDEKNKDLCKDCSTCCRYVAVEIDTPEDENDFENIKWFVSHKNVWVYTDEDNKWYLQFDTECKELDELGHCKSYSKRPKICREHSQEDCDKYSDEKAEVLSFKNPEDIDKYLLDKHKL